MVYTLPAKERIRRRFGSSRYIVSKAGITKILAIIILMVAGILFLTENDTRKCRGENKDFVKSPEWFPWLFPLATVASAAISALIYAAYLLKLAKKSLKLWVILDLSVSMVLIIATLIISILVITSCKPIKTVNNIPGPLGIVGTAFLILNAAATYFMWRYEKDDGDSARNSSQYNPRQQSARSRASNLRESITALEVDKGEYGV